MRLPKIGDFFLERYRVDGVLGEGGFALVFLATDTRSSRTVALKVLKPGDHGYKPDTVSRFNREARIVAALTDPHTITMFDQGRSPDGFLFMVFEYVPGVDLSELLANVGRLTTEAAVHVLCQVLESLREAHAAGLLHRDLKPENIRVFEYMGDPLNVKLLDFGIARPAVSKGEFYITRSGEMVGTPRYMSPEQLLEQELGPPSDIYSLGLIAYELLMGRDALQGNAWAQQIDRLKDDHVFVIPMMSTLPPQLRAVVERMTARNPRDRYQSAQEVLAAFNGLGVSVFADPFTPTEGIVPPHVHASSTPAETAPSPRPESPARPASFNWALAAVAVLGLLVVGLVVRIATHERRPAPQAPAVPLVAPVPVVVAKQSEPSPSVPSEPVHDAGQADQRDAGHADQGVAAAEPASGCGRPPEHKGAGVLRSVTDQVLVHIPKNYDPDQRYPVVLLLHQDLRAPAHILEQSRFGRLADKEGFLVVVPQALEEMNSWAQFGDLARVRAGLDLVEEKLCVDRDRVYAVGHLFGGRMAERLSCQPWIAAIATNSYRREVGFDYCDEKGPVPYLHITPMNSPRMPLEGGYGCVAVERMGHDSYVNIWRKRNQCTDAKRRVRKRKGARCWEYECAGAPFAMCELRGGAGWPGRADRPELSIGDVFGVEGVGCVDKIPNFPATRRIWQFFESTGS